MAAVQIMCARIGKVTGRGLAGNFKERFPRWLLLVFVAALLAANTINIAADLAGMADAAAMLSGINSHWFVVVFALLVSWATVRLQYHQIANVLKWLVLVLFAYPVTLPPVIRFRLFTRSNTPSPRETYEAFYATVCHLPQHHINRSRTKHVR